MWECPQLISFGDREVLVVSAWSPVDGILHTLALTGHRREMHLDEEALSRVDLGSAFYAASVMRSPEGGIVWGWVREEREESWCVEADWSGAITFPRRAELRSDGTLALRPIEAMSDLRGRLVAGDDSDTGSLTVPGTAFELEVTPNGRRIDIEIRFSGDEYFALALDPIAGTVTMDAVSASNDPRAHGSRVAFADPLDADDSVRLFVDGSILELFTGSGRSATMRVYPTTPPPWRVLLDDPEAEVRLWMLAADRPGAAWPDAPGDLLLAEPDLHQETHRA
jgi:beta-fructofuranosidase